MNARLFPAFLFSVFLGVVTAHGAAIAQQSVPTPAPAVASPSPSPTHRPLVFDGYVDAGYVSSIGASSLMFTNGVPSRVFDTTDRRVVLQNLDLRLTDNEPFGGLIEFGIGNDANVIAPFGRWFSNGQDLTQAYLRYTKGKFTLIGGKFDTLAGAEVIRSVDDVNYSRSILFGYAVPYTHTGLRLTYAPNSNVSLIGGVNNGWDDLRDTNSAKTLEGGLIYTPPGKVSVTVDGYSGVEQVSGISSPVSGISGNRSLLDVVAAYKASGVTTVSLNYDAGSQANAFLVNSAGSVTGSGTARWNGIAGYVTQQLGSKFSGTIRLETFDDAGGYRTGFDQQWNEGTLTLAYAPSSQFLFRGEVRSDSSNHSVFTNSDGTGRSNLQSVGLEAIVRF